VNAPSLFSRRSLELQARVREFMETHVHPNEETFDREIEAAENRFSTPPILETLKGRARDEGLWNLFLPPDAEPGDHPAEVSGDDAGGHYGAGLSVIMYLPQAVRDGTMLHYGCESQAMVVVCSRRSVGCGRHWRRSRRSALVASVA
jgi:alkylation response protein AidB-like acyl-CoA dehydrogenase